MKVNYDHYKRVLIARGNSKTANARIKIFKKNRAKIKRSNEK